MTDLNHHTIEQEFQALTSSPELADLAPAHNTQPDFIKGHGVYVRHELGPLDNSWQVEHTLPDENGHPEAVIVSTLNNEGKKVYETFGIDQMRTWQNDAQSQYEKTASGLPKRSFSKTVDAPTKNASPVAETHKMLAPSGQFAPDGSEYLDTIEVADDNSDLSPQSQSPDAEVTDVVEDNPPTNPTDNKELFAWPEVEAKKGAVAEMAGKIALKVMGIALKKLDAYENRLDSRSSEAHEPVPVNAKVRNLGRAATYQVVGARKEARQLQKQASQKRREALAVYDSLSEYDKLDPSNPVAQHVDKLLDEMEEMEEQAKLRKSRAGRKQLRSK